METIELLRTMENISESLERRASEAVEQGMFDYAWDYQNQCMKLKQSLT